MVEEHRLRAAGADRPFSAAPQKPNSLLENLALVAGFFVLISILQWFSGACRSELAQYPDEPAHAVTALMFGDYVRAGFPESPLAYAERYYVHYPKVAVGMWPPLFYGAAGAWTLVFGASRMSLLAFAALLGALLCASLSAMLRPMYGRAAGLAAGVVLAFLRIVQASNDMVMLDVAVALACFWSMMLLVEYFRTERLRTAIAFGLVTACGMLVKGNANACVLMIPFMLLLTRRFHLLKRTGLYAAGVVILMIGLPWQIVSLKMLSTSVPMEHISLGFVLSRMAGYSYLLARQFTPLVAALIVLGLVAGVWPRLTKSVPDTLVLAGASSLFLAVLIFHCLAPNPGPDERYMTPALAPGIALFVVGCHLASRVQIPFLPGTAARTAMIAGAALVSAWLFGAFTLPRFEPFGFIPAAKAAIASGSPRNAMLVCSDSLGEGGLISEVALKDRKLSRIVLRSSKVVSQGPWSGDQARILFQDTGALAKYLDAVAVDVVVVDNSEPKVSPARDLLVACLRRQPGEWKPAEVSGAPARDLTVYGRVDKSHLVPGRIRFSLPYTLGRDVELKSR